MPARPISLLLALPVLLLTACTPTPAPTDEPYTDTITTAFTGTVFNLAGDPIASCGGNQQFCTTPFYGLMLTAPATLTPDAVCKDLVTTASAVADIEGYTSHGQAVGGPIADLDTVTQFCTDGLSTPLTTHDGFVFTQGTILIDNGGKDAIASQFIITRDNPTSEYRLELTFSRKRSELTWTIDENYTPAHLTAEEVEANNLILQQQIEAQDFVATLIGKTETDAIATLEAAGYNYVVFQRDNQENPVTGSPSKRILLNIQDGIVADAISG